MMSLEISSNVILSGYMETISTEENSKSSHNKVTRKSEAITSPLSTFFNFMYFSFICPTRFLKDPTSNLFYGRQWLIQKVICGILNILNCWQYTGLIRLVLPNKLSDFEGNPTMYFKFFHRLGTIIYRYVIMKSFWFDWKLYLDILNFLLKRNTPCFKSRKLISSKIFWNSFQGLIMVVVFWSMFVGDRSPLISIHMHQWSAKMWLENLVRYARFTFNFEESNQNVPDLNRLSAWDWIICVTLIISDIRGKILIMFSDVTILAAAVTLRAASSEFADLVKNATAQDEENEPNIKLVSKTINFKPDTCNRTQSWKTVYENFQAVQILSDKINLVIGNIVSIYLAEGLLYYSGKLGLVIFLDWEKYHRLDLFVLSTLFIAVLKTSADIGPQMTAIKTWLIKSNHRKSAPLEEVNLVLYDLTTNYVGIKGNDMFTITYGFLGGFSGLILTLFIITTQHKEQ